MWSLSSSTHQDGSAEFPREHIPDAVGRLPCKTLFGNRGRSEPFASRQSKAGRTFTSRPQTAGNYNRGEVHSPKENVRSRNFRLGVPAQMTESLESDACASCTTKEVKKDCCASTKQASESKPVRHVRSAHEAEPRRSLVKLTRAVRSTDDKDMCTWVEEKPMRKKSFIKKLSKLSPKQNTCERLDR